MKIGYFGNPQHSADVLQKLIEENIEISFVVSNLDKPQKRNKKKLIASEVKQLAQKYRIPVFQFEKFDQDAFKKLQSFATDLFVVYAFGKILPKFIYEIPKFKTINLHTSLLPNFRGASPVQAAILNNQNKTGITLQYIEEKMDSGDIISQKEIPIEQQDTGKSLLVKLTKIGIEALLELLNSDSKIFNSKAQNHTLATYCKKITAMDRKIEFNEKSLDIFNKVRAFFDNYICYTSFRGKRINLIEVKLSNLQLEASNQPGTIQIYEKKLFVECLDQKFIELTVLQPEGKKQMSAKDFLNGYKIEKGSLFGER